MRVALLLSIYRYFEISSKRPCELSAFNENYNIKKLFKKQQRPDRGRGAIVTKGL